MEAREYQIYGPQGGIAFKVTLPEDFNTETDRCPMVILMHGIFSSKDYNPMPALARGLAQAGIASIRFDFNGHGKSEGRMQDMTVEKEIADEWPSGSTSRDCRMSPKSVSLDTRRAGLSHR